MSEVNYFEIFREKSTETSFCGEKCLLKVFDKLYFEESRNDITTVSSSTEYY